MSPFFGKDKPKARPYNPYLIAHRAAIERIGMHPPLDLVAFYESKQGTNTREGDFDPTPLTFGENDPDCFWPGQGTRVLEGQERAKELLDILIHTTEPGERMPPLLLSGPAGTGKTVTSKIVTRYLNDHRESPGRFFKVLPSQLTDVKILDRLMLSLQEHDVVFVDEAHDLPYLEAFFPVLDTTGDCEYPLSTGQQLLVPKSVSWIFATTEPGELDRHTGGAFGRRVEEIRMDPLTNDDLVRILEGRGLPIHPEAAYEAAERSNQLPWQIIKLYDQAERVAKYQEVEEVLPGHMNKAFDLLGMDERGLLPEDRDIIKILFKSPYTLKSGKFAGTVVYRMNEQSLCAAAGVDPTRYKKRVQPKLQRQGLLTTTGGQSLTEKAVQLYGHLKDE